MLTWNLRLSWLFTGLVPGSPWVSVFSSIKWGENSTLPLSFANGLMHVHVYCKVLWKFQVALFFLRLLLLMMCFTDDSCGIKWIENINEKWCFILFWLYARLCQPGDKWKQGCCYDLPLWFPSWFSSFSPCPEQAALSWTLEYKLKPIQWRWVFDLFELYLPLG